MLGGDADAPPHTADEWLQDEVGNLWAALWFARSLSQLSASTLATNCSGQDQDVTGLIASAHRSARVRGSLLR
jgi:hypothetical protein